MQRNLNTARRGIAMSAETLSTTADQPLNGPLLFTPRVFSDAWFYESWNERRFRHDLIRAGVPAAEAEAQFQQDNHSRSSRGVLRGLHFQLPPEPQGKLVRCSVGAIFDVAVDCVGTPSVTASGWGRAER